MSNAYIKGLELEMNSGWRVSPRFLKNAGLTSLVILTLLGVSLTCESQSQVVEPIKDVDLFVKQYNEAARSGAAERARDLVRRAQYVLPKHIIDSARAGIRAIAEGKDATEYFSGTREVATWLAEETGNAEILKLFQRHTQYDRQQAVRYVEALGFIDAAVQDHKAAKYELALQNLTKAAGMLNGLGATDAEMAVEEVRSTIDSAMGRNDEASKGFQKVLDAMRLLKNVPGEARTLRYLAETLLPLHRLTDMAKALNRAQELSVQLQDKVGEAGCLVYLAIVDAYLNKYDLALRKLDRALMLAKAASDFHAEADVYSAIGFVNARVGQWDKAAEAFELSLERYTKLEDRINIAHALKNAGEAYARLEEYGPSDFISNIFKTLLDPKLVEDPKSLQYYNKALVTYKDLGLWLPYAGCVSALARLYEKLYFREQALKTYKLAMDAYRRIDDKYGEAMARQAMASLYISMNKLPDAQAHLIVAEKLAARVGDQDLLATVYQRQAMLHVRKNEKLAAYDAFEKAYNLTNSVLKQSIDLDEKMRSSLLEHERGLFLSFVDLLRALHAENPTNSYAKRAFAVAEQAKSRRFQEILSRGSTAGFLTGGQGLAQALEQERALTERVAMLRMQLQSATGDRWADGQVLREQLKQATQELDEQVAHLRTEFPRYAELKHPKGTSVESMQQWLTPGEVLVSYVVSTQTVSAFVLSNIDFQFVPLSAKPLELMDLVKRFRSSIDGVSQVAHLERLEPSVLLMLYEKLFAPLEPLVKGAHQIYIVPDNVLYALPFEALIDRPFDVNDFSEKRKRGKSGKSPFLGEYALLHYLVDSYRITYLPFASALRSLREHRKPAYGKWENVLVAFADPVFNSSEQNDGKKNEVPAKSGTPDGWSRSRSIAFDLPRLPDSATEVEKIAMELDSNKDDLYLRERATEQNVWLADLKKAQYVIFATHGLLGGAIDGVTEPTIVLTLVDNPQEYDGLLTMSEVMGLDLNAEMVVLSACNTYGIRNKANVGEGFVGLARSMIYAGAQSLLITHWEVDSTASRDLTVGLFERRKHVVGSEALRQAKLWLKNTVIDQFGGSSLSVSRAHPFFWAPYVLIGNDGQ